MNKWFWVGIVAIACVVVALLLYSNPAEKARVDYEKALSVELKGDLDQADALYAKILADYPSTEGATLAEEAQQRIASKRSELLKKEMLDQIERILLIFNGYKSMFGHLPESPAELDGSEYFFDSAYLAELVPAGYTTYVVFGDSAPFGIWPIRDDKDMVLAAQDLNGTAQEESKADALKRIEEAYVETGRKGHMVFLQHK